jgi:hypothetical protein
MALDDGTHRRRNTVELANPESIRTLIASFVDPNKAVQQRHGLLDVSRSPRRHQRMICRCGHCQWCLDNARWERIFAEKFADPNYYTSGAVTRMASPLTSI